VIYNLDTQQWEANKGSVTSQGPDQRHFAGPRNATAADAEAAYRQYVLDESGSGAAQQQRGQ